MEKFSSSKHNRSKHKFNYMNDVHKQRLNKVKMQMNNSINKYKDNVEVSTSPYVDS